MTDDIQVGLLYILGHIHAPTPEQVPVLPCGLPSMPSRKTIHKLHTIALACDWIHDQIEKSIAAEEAQMQKAQEPLPFVESTPESYHEENGVGEVIDPALEKLRQVLSTCSTETLDFLASFDEPPATEPTPCHESQILEQIFMSSRLGSEEAQEAYIRAKLNLDSSEPTPEFSSEEWDAMRLARDYVMGRDRTPSAAEAYRLWGNHPLTGLTRAIPPDEPPALEVPQVEDPAGSTQVTVTQRRKSVYIDGVAYKNLSAAARARGLNVEAVRSRVKRGWTLAQALELTLPPRGVVVDGVGYQTLAHACRAVGADYHDARSKINRGMTAQQVIGE